MIELYYTQSCPYCVKVRSFLEKEGTPYVSKELPKFREELRALGGKTQVPFLNDPERGVKMYESDDIIAYVREHYSSRSR